MHQRPTTTAGLLGDTASRDYSAKLRRFNAFAAPELRQAIASLALTPGMHILDAGCGTGEALSWLAEHAGGESVVFGVELAAPHAREASLCMPSSRTQVLQADILHLPFPPESFDLIWSVNVIHHLHAPPEGAAALKALLRPGGRLAFGQSSFLPDMYFAWDSRLERLVNEAVRQYYRDRYRLDERELASVRGLVGLLQRAGLGKVRAKTFLIERTAPLRAADEDYLLQTLFRDTWGTRLQPYLPGDDHAELLRLCDPADERYALRRPDFHFLQTFTLAVGEA